MGKKNVTTEGGWERESLGDAMLLALKMEDEAISQGMEATSRN